MDNNQTLKALLADVIIMFEEERLKNDALKGLTDWESLREKTLQVGRVEAYLNVWERIREYLK